MRAFSVHVLTASGAGLSLLALMMAAQQRWAAMFVVLGIALVVDGIDGPLARRWQVGELLPRWSGDALDFVVDYTTYVFVPAFVIGTGGLMPPVVSLVCAIIVAVTGALYFADREMKTDDNHFKGFPAVWNVVVFYLLLLDFNGWIAAMAVVMLAGLTFAPIRFVHPLRVQARRALNIGLLAIWSGLAVVALWANMQPAPLVTWTLAAIAVYFMAAGLISARR